VTSKPTELTVFGEARGENLLYGLDEVRMLHLVCRVSLAHIDQGISRNKFIILIWNFLFKSGQLETY